MAKTDRDRMEKYHTRQTQTMFYTSFLIDAEKIT